MWRFSFGTLFIVFWPLVEILAAILPYYDWIQACGNAVLAFDKALNISERYCAIYLRVPFDSW